MFKEFVGEINQKSLFNPSRFIVLFENPWLDTKIKMTRRNLNTRLSLRCFTANLPSRFFQTHERDIAGPLRKIPFSTQYDELSLQFYCGQDLFELNFFQGWMDSILNPVTRYASYYDDYAKNSRISVLFLKNSISKPIKELDYYGPSGVRFIEAYPRVISINGGPVEWAPKTQPFFITVTFGCREFVNVQTYDDEYKRQLEKLNKSDFQNSLDDLIERSGGEATAYSGTTSRKEIWQDDDPLFVNPYIVEELVQSILEEREREEREWFRQMAALDTGNTKTVAR